MTSVYKRKCKNWLLTFRDWTLPRSEAKESYIFWTGLFTLASAIKRKVIVPASILGSYEVAPYIYVMFVAPAGKARKTTTMTYADDLLLEEIGINKASASMTSQVLALRLSETKDGAISIQSKEFGVFYNQSKTLMIDFLTAAFDGVKSYDSDTIGRGIELSERPCINLLAATTPIWIAENLTESAIGGGFSSRVIFIYEDTVRRRKLLYNRGEDKIDLEELKRLREDLLSDLIHIAQDIDGEFSLDQEAEEFIDPWYHDNADNPKNDDARLTGYHERKPVYVFKLAMLLSLSYSDKLILNKSDFEQAITILEGVEGKMLQTFQSVGKNPHSLDIDTIRDFVTDNGPVTMKEIKQKFQYMAEPSLLETLVDFALVTGDIEMYNVNGRESYRGRKG